MKDGYYLSTYIHIDELVHLMGVRRRHDQNISLWLKEGNRIKLVHFWELERMTGCKQHPISFYDTNHAIQFINELLKEYNLTINDMIEIWGSPKLETCNDYHAIEDYPQLSYHSMSHLFSAVMMDTDKFYNGNIIGLSVDGGPDGVLDTSETKKFFYAGCAVQNGEIEMFPVFSPGSLWFYANLCFNLREGTLMALASASKSKLLMQLDDILLVRDMSSLTQIFDFIKNLINVVDKLNENDEGKLFTGFDPLFSIEENKISMVMKVIQDISIKIMEKNIDDILTKYNMDPKETYLALSGGYALNCPTNSYLMQKYGFKGFIAPPCVSDSGLSLGIGLYAFYKKMDKVQFKLGTSYYGNEDERLDIVATSSDFSSYIKQISDFCDEQAIEDVINSPIVWFDGRAEIGPRALGHRSIIGDPRSQKTRDTLNVIKRRQWWRPVAPIILEEDLKDWFEDAYPSPFMLHTFMAKGEKENLIPAITHLDGSARVQSISEIDNKRLYTLIKKFKEKTKVPVICNTSLNDIGEPIIDRIDEALNFALRKGIKVAYINGKRVELFNHSMYLEDKPLKRKVEFSIFDEKTRNDLLKQINPHNVPKDVLQIYFESNLQSEYDLLKEEDCRRLTIYARFVLKNRGVSIC